MTTYLGYSRVSTEKQSIDLQAAALRPLCGDNIRSEKASGMSQASRSELAALVTEAKRLASTGEQVTIVVYSLSRLGRRLVETISLLEDLRSAGVEFMSLTESIDTSNPMGRCFLAIIAALAQAEAEVLSERTRAGLKARREAGVQLGRRAEECSTQVEQAKLLMASGSSLRKAAKQTGLTSSMLSRRLKSA